MVTYTQLAENMGLTDTQVLLFTNHGVYTVEFSEFDQFHENMEVSQGEEGLTNKYILAVTKYNATVEHSNGHIWRSFTQEDN